MSLDQKQVRILLLGLDESGKTTLLYKLKLNELSSTIPTIGFNVETINFNNFSFTIWDVGGQERVRSLWVHYYDNTQAIIFVVDSSDRERLTVAKEELHKALAEENLVNVPVLVLANKQDLPNAISADEISELLAMNVVTGRSWFVQNASVMNGNGISEGLGWLSRALG